jgi:hypothetical protein
MKNAWPERETSIQSHPASAGSCNIIDSEVIYLHDPVDG